MFEGQGIMQMVCLYLALACIPVMLFGKPLYITYVKKRKSPGKSYVSSSASITVKCFERLRGCWIGHYVKSEIECFSPNREHE